MQVSFTIDRRFVEIEGNKENKDKGNNPRPSSITLCTEQTHFLYNLRENKKRLGRLE